jgi:FMN phosphatase YigB (HAD superfamily)
MIEIALEAVGVPAAEALFVGDRPEVDGIAAKRAGVRYVDIGSVTFRELIYSLPSRGEFL